MNSDSVDQPDGGGKAVWMWVSPQQARAWRTHPKSHAQRRLNIRNLIKIRRAIKEESWMPTGEALKIGPNGELLDGNHRCLACEQAEKPFYTLVLFNIDPAALVVMDTGKPRNVADVLSTVEGAVKNTGHLGSVVSMAWAVDNLGPRDVAEVPQNDVAARLYHQDREGFDRTVMMCPKSLSRGILSGKRAGWLAYVTDGAAIPWVENVVMATNLQPGSGATTLNRMIWDYRTRKMQITPPFAFYVIVRCYVSDALSRPQSYIKTTGLTFDEWPEMPARLFPRLGRCRLDLLALSQDQRERAGEPKRWSRGRPRRPTEDQAPPSAP